MRHDVVLARYGEIGIKSRPVRHRFEMTLRDNIERAFQSAGMDVVVRRIPGRFLITSSDLERARGLLVRIFGLTSISGARVVPSALDEVLAAIPGYFDEIAASKPEARTFALRTRRSGSHNYTSQDLARLGGGTILDRPGGDRWKVDLSQPDIALHVEVRDNQAYIFHEVENGPGGLPYGTQGKVVVLLKDRNSLAAAWLMMKRGCSIVPVTFTGPTGRPEVARRHLQVLRAWHFPGSLVDVPHEEAGNFPAPLTCTLCMRQMIRKADLVARRRHAKGIVTGETFQSTTFDNIDQFADVATVPVLRPLVGLGPGYVQGLLDRLEVSSALDDHREPCPLRVRGRTEPERVHHVEEEQAVGGAARDAVWTKASVAS